MNPLAELPVDGGAVFRDEKLVVTQPSKGEFKAFSAVCTHQGCVVAEVTAGQIVCPCHGSHFSIEDGAPVSGPAKAPLAAKKVHVNMTKEDIKSAPDYDRDDWNDESRTRYSDYYGSHSRR